MYRILLVDDEALIREAVSDNVQWEEYGYELAGSCENGKEALEFIEKNPVDVVLTDICMPYMDGMQLSEKLSEEYPSTKIIILSGYDDFDYAKKAIRYGVKEYLLKPITAEEMGKALLDLKTELDKERKAERKISELESAYRKGQQLLYSDALLHLIRGSKADEEIRRELAKVGLNLDSAVYRVAVVELDIYARSTYKLDEERKRESALMAFVLHNISQEIVGRNKAGEVCQGKDHRTYILLHSNRPVEFRQRVKNICREIIGQMNQIMQLAVNIGLGSYVTETENIYKSYEEAEEALEYHYIMGGNHVMEIEEIREGKRQADVDEIMDAIALHVKGNESRKIEEDFRNMEKVLRDCFYDRRSAGVILQRVVDMLDELCRLSGTEESRKIAREEVLERALAAEQMKEALDILIACCMETGEWMDSQKNIGGKKYAVMAMDYIEKNYGDCDLSLHSVCSYLNISTSRFSAIFKQVTGTTFMDVLIGLRMQKAKELLEHTDMKNYEIAERVGFNDSHYFSIAFKKITGKTPTEYAREMRK